MKGYLCRFVDLTPESGEEKNQYSASAPLTKLTKQGSVGFVSTTSEEIPIFRPCAKCGRPAQIERGEGWEHLWCDSGCFDSWERDPARRWRDLDARITKYLVSKLTQ